MAVLSVIVTVALLTIVTSSPVPGITPPTQVAVLFQSPPVPVDVIGANADDVESELLFF